MFVLYIVNRRVQYSTEKLLSKILALVFLLSEVTNWNDAQPVELLEVCSSSTCRYCGDS